MTAPPSSSTPAAPLARADATLERDQFATDELAIVLSHFELSIIRRIRPLARGSRRSPKVRIDTELGSYLLKRRAVGRDDARRVAFAHDLHERLQRSRYPVPALMATRTDGSTLVRLGGRSYELFAYVNGRRDDGSTAATVAAGDALARFHELLVDVEQHESVPRTSFHAAAALEPAMQQLPIMIAAAESGTSAPEIEALTQRIGRAYREAAARVDDLGLADLPARILHGDWHPGNLLFRDGAVVGVLDLDSVRCEPRIIDLANGALQFSMAMPEHRSPREWPKKLSARRIGAIVRGYRRASTQPLEERELAMIPWLMIEALVLEAVVPIAATGRFARLDGAAFLEMVWHKIEWIAPRAHELTAHLARRT